MTKHERSLIKAAVNWFHADHTPLQEGQDNPADVTFTSALEAAAREVYHDYVEAGTIDPIPTEEQTSAGYVPPFPRQRPRPLRS
jgi:hypothetical protein